MIARRTEEDVDNFYVSWGDLVSLLLVFFIYLFSISEIDVVKFLQVRESVTSEIAAQDIPDEGVLQRLKKEQEALKEMKAQIETYIINNELQDDVQVEYTQDRLELNLGNALLFELGKADLKFNAKQLLNEVGNLMQSSNGYIVVEGHTDDIPVQTDQFPSNWELSSSRASSVVRFLGSQNVDLSRFRVLGMGQYDPLVPNDSAENRAKNRRVKITVKPNITTSKGVAGE